MGIYPPKVQPSPLQKKAALRVDRLYEIIRESPRNAEAVLGSKYKDFYTSPEKPNRMIARARFLAEATRKENQKGKP